ncbi:hypothetical protein ACEQPO_00030 [Bacillus sp. SL00103]
MSWTVLFLHIDLPERDELRARMMIAMLNALKLKSKAGEKIDLSRMQ